MAVDITLQGKIYNDVPSVILPTVNGGTATFTLNGEGGTTVIIPYESKTTTLTIAGWSSSNLTQTVTVSGVTANSNIFISPDQNSYSAYMLAGVQCIAQGSDSLTFSCAKIPTAALTVNLLVISEDGSGTSISGGGSYSNATTTTAGLMSAADKTKLDGMPLAAYPIGSFYTSVDNTSPASLFGGTWEAIGTSGSVVIEAGTSGSWTWRKWSDGTAECWGNVTTTPTSWEAWGSIYEANPLVYLSYPTSLFATTPTLLVNSDTQNNGSISIEVYTNGSAIRTPNLAVLRPTTGAENSSYNIAFYAIGKWTTTASSINKFYSWKRTA